MYFLEWSCTTQVRALGMGRPLRPIDQAVQDHVSAQAVQVFDSEVAAGAYWPAMLRKARRECPGFDA